MKTNTFPYLLQCFFTERLLGELGASPHTVASYRDTFRLLLGFASKRLGREPSKIEIEALDGVLLGEFLTYLERDRHTSIRSRNNRLAALRAFFRFVTIKEPALALQCQRILAIPGKRHDRAPVTFLTDAESTALLDAPDKATWIGRRDRTLLLVAIQTGLRNSEITALCRQDVAFGTGAHIRCMGKGRKSRCTPLRVDVAASLQLWLNEQADVPGDPVFPCLRGGALSSDAFQRLVDRHVTTAASTCPSLGGKKVTPHTLRHTAAMDMLRRGVDLCVIALWLGHESTETTQIYIHADMGIK